MMIKGAVIAAGVLFLAVAVGAIGIGRGAVLTADREVATQDAAAQSSVPTQAQKTNTQPSAACAVDDSTDAQDRQDADPADTPDAQDASDRQDGDPGNTPEAEGTDP